MNKIINILNQDGQLAVTSRQVAEDFEKRHADVIEKIEEIIKTENSVMTMFIESSYKAGTGKSYKEYLITRDGFSLLVMGFTGSKALQWKLKYIEAFNKMEEHIKGQTLNTSELSPELQMFNKMFQALANNELEQKRIKFEIEKTNEKVEETKEEIQGIRDVVAINSTDWKLSCKNLITKIAYQIGGISHINDVYKEVYSTLDRRLGTKLQVRLTNKRRRMADEGVCKSKRDKLNYINVIEDDKKLIEGYVAIVKELAIKYGVA